MGNRRLFALVALMATLALALVLDRQSSSTSVTTAESEPFIVATDAETTAESAVLSIKPRASPSDMRDAFAVRYWTPPPKISAPAPQAPSVEAPPLPFTYIGTQRDTGRVLVFLTYENQTHIAEAGDVLADNYRVERIEPHRLTMRYLPTDEIQTLSIGSGK